MMFIFAYDFVFFVFDWFLMRIIT